MENAAKRIYAAIDLKSFYASVECAARGFDPLTTNLVVADESRTDKTICLAVSPSLKQYGIPGRARLFEVKQMVSRVNDKRQIQAPGRILRGESIFDADIQRNPNLAVGFFIATPRMKEYIRISSLIYETYLSFLSKEDIHVYSIDEVFLDLTPYLTVYEKSPKEIVSAIIKAIYEKTGITATGGIGTNLYLAKVAMDILAKHEDPDENGVRIAYLDEETYKKTLWDHKPLTSFWRVGKGYARRLEKEGIFTMGDIARKALLDQSFFYKEFGVNAEILIDHAFGIETTEIKDIKAYKSKSSSMSIGQVLMEPYGYVKGKLIVKEMTERLCLDLLEKNLCCLGIALNLDYDSSDISSGYEGEVGESYYGKAVPKGDHGSVRFEKYTTSRKIMLNGAVTLYERLMKRDAHVRRIVVIALETVDKGEGKKRNTYLTTQLSLFDEVPEIQEDTEEDNLQETILSIQRKFGKNAVLKAMDVSEGATAVERNKQVGGHKG